MLASDLHIHTVMSGHAFCTFNECVAEAAAKGLSLIAITDHGPSYQNGPDEVYFVMSSRLPKRVGATQVLFGCEMNIIDGDGTVDLAQDQMDALDIVIAGLHRRTPYQGGTAAENTRAVIRTMEKNPSVSFITHPYSHSYPVIIDDIVKASLDCGVLLEVNASLVLDALRDLNTPRRAALFNANLRMVELLQNNNQGFVINSDAHHTAEIGIDENQVRLLCLKLHIERQYVLNDNLEKLEDYISTVR